MKGKEKKDNRKSRKKKETECNYLCAGVKQKYYEEEEKKWIINK